MIKGLAGLHTIRAITIRVN